MQSNSEEKIEMLAGKIDGISADISEINKELKSNREDHKQFREEFKQNREEFKQNREEFKQNREEHKQIREDHARQGILMEALSSDVQKILEVVTDSNEKLEKIDVHERRLDSHDESIDLTQKALRKHITNNKIHLKS